jgi:hypothetical protein
MGKPETIGYQNDPDNWSAPRLPDMAIDSDGFWIERPGGVREPVEDVDGFMRYHGYKRVYKPRNFRAVRETSGYHVYCKTCDDTSWTGIPPHDYAVWHTSRYHTARHYSASWPLDLVE